MMKRWFFDNLLYFIGGAVGAVAGYMYWHEVGCSSGACGITSNPVSSALYGMLLGSLFLGGFRKAPDKPKVKSE